MPCEDFDEFFLDDFPRLIGFVCSLGFPPALAEDAAAEAMYKARERWDRLEQPRPWVRTTAKHHAQRQLIRDIDGVRRAVQGGWLPSPEGHNPMGLVEAQLLRDELLGELPDRQREVMAWTFDGFEPAEIAQQMNESPETVRSNLRHAREKLKQLYRTQLGTAREGGV